MTIGEDICSRRIVAVLSFRFASGEATVLEQLDKPVDCARNKPNKGHETHKIQSEINL
jgi:hypothetical protein